MIPQHKPGFFHGSNCLWGRIRPSAPWQPPLRYLQHTMTLQRCQPSSNLRSCTSTTNQPYYLKWQQKNLATLQPTNQNLRPTNQNHQPTNQLGHPPPATPRNLLERANDTLVSSPLSSCQDRYPTYRWGALFCLMSDSIMVQIWGFLKWYPTTICFPTKNDHFGVFWGYHNFRKHPFTTPRKKKPEDFFWYNVICFLDFLSRIFWSSEFLEFQKLHHPCSIFSLPNTAW